MAQSAPARTKINTKVTQPAPGRPSRRPAGPGQAAGRHGVCHLIRSASDLIADSGLLAAAPAARVDARRSAGSADVDGTCPMARDSIFRIFTADHGTGGRARERREDPPGLPDPPLILLPASSRPRQPAGEST